MTLPTVKIALAVCFWSFACGLFASHYAGPTPSLSFLFCSSFLGSLSILRTPTDIFPNIDIPVVTVIWSYHGLSPTRWRRIDSDLRARASPRRSTTLSTSRSQTLNGVSVIKIYFHPGANVEAGVAQVTAISQTTALSMPPGTLPPLIITYSASSVPVLQLGSFRRRPERAAAERYGQRTLFARSWPRCRAPPSRFPMAASSGRCRWISTARNCRPRDLSPADVVQRIQRAEFDFAGRNAKDRATSNTRLRPTAPRAPLRR